MVGGGGVRVGGGGVVNQLASIVWGLGERAWCRVPGQGVWGGGVKDLVNQHPGCNHDRDHFAQSISVTIAFLLMFYTGECKVNIITCMLQGNVITAAG